MTVDVGITNLTVTLTTLDRWILFQPLFLQERKDAHFSNPWIRSCWKVTFHVYFAVTYFVPVFVFLLLVFLVHVFPVCLPVPDSVVLLISGFSLFLPGAKTVRFRFCSCMKRHRWNATGRLMSTDNNEYKYYGIITWITTFADTTILNYFSNCIIDSKHYNIFSCFSNLVQNDLIMSQVFPTFSSLNLYFVLGFFLPKKINNF